MSTFDRSISPTPAPVREFHFPPVKRSTLANGLTVIGAAHGQIPLVTFALVVHAGAEHDTRATAGLAYLTARSLEAGTRSRSADRVAWDFELLGTELDVTVVFDYAALSVTVPVEKAEAALALLAEIATAPAFADDEVERLKREQLAELEQRRAEPRALANDMATQFIYAPDVPYARPVPGTTPSVKHLTTDHVRDFYQAHWRPAQAALVSVGALDEATVQELVVRHFGDWSGGASENVEVDVGTTIERAQLFIVDREGAVQSEIRAGHVGLTRSTPDYFAIAVGNGILGGVFTSRLNMSLREEHGWTYGVRSAFAMRKHEGPFLIQTAVASDVTSKALQELLQQTRQLVQNGASEEEVVAAREYMAGVMPLEMQTTEELAARIAEIFVYGLSDDYLPQHRAALLAVTRDEANAAARAHIKPDQFAITIVGDAKAIESDLAALDIGPIEVHTINE
ncbi:MAG TPA: pitrilysin family protein [Longimicrobiales bacterium]|nr:pitrilysin family protein [Longimicrobiales bacterium]